MSKRRWKHRSQTKVDNEWYSFVPNNKYTLSVESADKVSAASKLDSLSANHSVSSSRLAKLALSNRTLTTAQQEKRFRKDQFWVKTILLNNWSQDQNRRKSSYKEHRVDALAPYADEGRGKLRKATGSRKQAPIRRYPNGGTRQLKRLSP